MVAIGNGGHWSPMVAIGTDRHHILNGSVAIGTGQYELAPVLVNGHQWERYERTLFKT